MKEYLNITLVTLFACVFLLSCGESEKERAERIRIDSVRTADSLAALLKPRKDIYEAAIGLLKENLKVPTSLRVPAIHMQNDSITIKHFGQDTAVVYGTYEAANSFGTLLAPEKFKVILVRRDGKWGSRWGGSLSSLDVKMSYMPEYDFEKTLK